MEPTLSQALIRAAGLDPADPEASARPPRLRPAQPERVGAVLALCHRHGLRLALVHAPQAPVPPGPEPAVVLDLSALDRIRRLDAADLVATVEPGVTGARLATATGEAGLIYPPDPLGLGATGLGAALAADQGGPRLLDHGGHRDHLLGVRGFLPDGRELVTGGANLKCVVGYDLGRLLAGSGGALLVPVELTLRLAPAPESRLTLAARFASAGEAQAAARALGAAGVRPAALEGLDGLDGLDGSGPQAACILLLELHGPPEETTLAPRRLSELLAAQGATSVAVPGPREARELWDRRRLAGPAAWLAAPGAPAQVALDPVARQLLAEIKELCDPRGVLPPSPLA